MESSNGLSDSAVDSNTQSHCHSGIPNDGETPCLYEVGEKVLAFHDYQFWNAKVMDMKHENRKWKYFVHYIGWKKRWDEWLEVESLKKYNDENVQNFLRKENLKRDAKAFHASHIERKSSSVRREKKQRMDSSDKGKVSLENLVNIQLPPMLKKQLVDDCEFISLLGKLVKLPRSPNVEVIMKKYILYRSGKEDGEVSLSLQEFTKGLCCYFNKALPVMLLYKSEREQYADAIKDGIFPSAVYGAEHLLRLFVKLPELLASANIEGESLRVLQPRFVSFLKFLKKNQSEFFLSTYHVLEETETSTNKEDD